MGAGSPTETLRPAARRLLSSCVEERTMYYGYGIGGLIILVLLILLLTGRL
jgi:hypothetical protein